MIKAHQSKKEYMFYSRYDSRQYPTKNSIAAVAQNILLFYYLLLLSLRKRSTGRG